MMGFEATTPVVAPFSTTQRPDHWKHFDDSVNAVSFGFVATAILISMFLLLAIFERFLRQRSSEANNVATPIDLERQMHFGRKLENLSPKFGGVMIIASHSYSVQIDMPFVMATSAYANTLLHFEGNSYGDTLIFYFAMFNFHQMTIYGRGVLVLMPGEQIPSFIALPAPAPCCREPMSWPIQVQHNSCFRAPSASRRDYNLTTRNMMVHPF
ncbi:hypothetical protein HKD37_12G033737 [Glycine soja]|nr:hypothetical protein JHK87_033334 [Glycine soja]KAG4985790.1 hypothetical protein JHK86_033481 [Glycine max]